MKKTFEIINKVMFLIGTILIIFILGVAYGLYIVKVRINQGGKTYTLTKPETFIITTEYIVDQNGDSLKTVTDTTKVSIIKP